MGTGREYLDTQDEEPTFIIEAGGTASASSSQPRSSQVPQSTSSKWKTAAHRPAKSSTRSATAGATEDQLVSTLKSQEQRSNLIHGQLAGLIAREESATSSVALWGSWMGSMAADIDPRLLPRFYRTTLETVLDFVEESRTLPPLVPVQQPAPLPIQMPNFPINQDEGLYTTMLPPLPSASTTYQVLQQPPQQDQQPFYHPITGQAMTNWNTSAPTAGRPERPSSTPSMLSGNLSGNLSGLNDINLSFPSPAGASFGDHVHNNHDPPTN